MNVSASVLGLEMAKNLQMFFWKSRSLASSYRVEQAETKEVSISLMSTKSPEMLMLWSPLTI